MYTKFGFDKIALKFVAFLERSYKTFIFFAFLSGFNLVKSREKLSRISTKYAILSSNCP